MTTNHGSYVLQGTKHRGERLCDVSKSYLALYLYKFPSSPNAVAVQAYLLEEGVSLIEDDDDDRVPKPHQATVAIAKRGNVNDWTVCSGKHAASTLGELPFSYLGWVVAVALTDDERTPSVLSYLLKRCEAYCDEQLAERRAGVNA